MFDIKGWPKFAIYYVRSSISSSVTDRDRSSIAIKSLEGWLWIFFT